MGGAETSLQELLTAVRSAEMDWQLWLLLGEDGPLATKARALGVRVIVERMPAALAELGDAGRGKLALSWSMLKGAAAAAGYVRRLAAICRSIDPDIIHTNGFKMHLLGLWAQRSSAAVIWHLHDYVSTRPFMRGMLRRTYRRCASAIANSKSVAADVSSLLPKLSVVPIYNAINFDRFSPAGGTVDLDALCGLKPPEAGTIRVGLVATFARWKGHMVFLRALSLLRPMRPVRGYIIGGPIYQTKGSQYTTDELREEAARLGLAGCVGFTGFLDDTGAAMRSLDIIVHASTEPEPFGMVIVEGMACGKPVVVSKAGGAAELFTEDETALGHAAGDAGSLAHQIERLASDAALRSRLGRAARLDVVRRFSRARLASELTQLYRKCHEQKLRGLQAGYSA